MLTLEQVKEFLRIDHEDEDQLLSSLLATSENFIKNATHPNAQIDTNEFQLAQRILISHWYENREAVGKADSLLFSLESLLFQIRYITEEQP